MAVNVVETYGIEIQLGVKNADYLQKSLGHAIRNMVALNKQLPEIEKEMERLVGIYLKFHGLTGKKASDIKTNALAQVSQTAQEILAKSGRGQKNLGKQAILSDRVRRAQIFAEFTDSRIGKALTAFRALSTAFAEAQGVWKFAEGIEKVNQKLLLLHYSSGIGVGSLKDLGAAAKAFGGSAESIASAEERRLRQMAKAKRGEGFGYLQEANWKYGFNIDLGWDATRTRMEAIEHARSNLAEEDWLSFAELVDPANAKMMLAAIRMSGAQYEQWKSWQSQMEEYGSLQTAGGENRGETTKKVTQEYEMASAQLSRSWEAVRDQIAIALLPLMTSLVNGIRGMVDWLNKNPELINTLTYLTGAIATLIATMKSISWVKWAAGALGGGGAASAAAGAAGASAAGNGVVSAIVAGAGTIGTAIAGAIAVAMAGYAGFELGKALFGDKVAKWIEEHFGDSEASADKNKFYTEQNKMERAKIKAAQSDWLFGSITQNAVEKSFYRGNEKSEALQSFEAFKAHIDKVRERIAAMQGIAIDQLEELDPTQLENLRNIYSTMSSSSSSTNTVDNSRTQNNQYININGAQDPQAVGDAVATAGKAMMGASLNATMEK